MLDTGAQISFGVAKSGNVEVILHGVRPYHEISDIESAVSTYSTCHSCIYQTASEITVNHYLGTQCSVHLTNTAFSHNDLSLANITRQ